MKICFAASTGGHFEQLMMLKGLMKKYEESFILTEKTHYDINVDGVKAYSLKQTNRNEIWFLPKMIFNTFKSLFYFMVEKPDVVITTGVLSMIPMSLISKIFRRKLIYIESFAKINSPTLSGRLLYKYADRFYVQWEEMLAIYPNAIYIGHIY